MFNPIFLFFTSYFLTQSYTVFKAKKNRESPNVRLLIDRKGSLNDCSRLFVVSEKSMDLLTFAQFKQVAYKFNFISDARASSVLLSKQTYKYASYCNLLKSTSVSSKINVQHLSSFLENEHLHYFSSNTINYNRIRKSLKYNIRTSALYLTRFWFFLRTIMRASYFIRRFKNVNMGILAKIKNLTHFSFLMSLGFCYNLTSFKAFLKKGYYMVCGSVVMDGEYGMLVHNSLLSIRIHNNDFPTLESYRRHIKRFFFLQLRFEIKQGYWGIVKKDPTIVYLNQLHDEWPQIILI